MFAFATRTGGAPRLTIQKVVLGLKDQNLEHGHRIERWAATLGPVAVVQTFQKPWTEMLEINGVIENLKRVTHLRKPLQVLLKPKETCLIQTHTLPPMEAVNHVMRSNQSG